MKQTNRLNNENDDKQHPVDRAEKQPKLLHTTLNSIRKDWHFNLRRINTNRANYLDYKQKQLDENLLAANDYYTIKNKETNNLDLIETNQHKSAESEFDQRLASIQLVNKPSISEPNQIKLNSDLNLKENFDFDTFKFDLNISLVDQVNSFKNSNNTNIIIENSNLNEIKTPQIDFKTFTIPLRSIVTQKTLVPSCSFEYLTQTSSNYVHNDCFQHVLTNFKQSKQHFNNTNVSSPNLTTANNKLNNFFKCEYIYGENYYWIVKIKRYYDSLYQIKFIRNGNNLQKSFNDDDLPPTPSSPSFSSLNSSLNKTSDDLRLNCSNKSYFFSIDSTRSASSSSNYIFKSLRPLGWSKSHGRQALKPVDFMHQLDNNLGLNSIEENLNNLFSYLKLNNTSEPFEENAFCELQKDLTVHLCKIKRNVSGRLLIECQDELKWIYYLDPCLHTIGWAKANNLNYFDQNISQNTDANTTTLKQQTVHEHELRQRHHFRFNYLMECLFNNKFYIARVIEILNDNCFKIELDSNDLKQTITFYSSNSTSLFPCKWCLQNNLKLELPTDWPLDKQFDWDIYVDNLNKSEQLFTQTTDINLFNWSRNLNQLSDRFQLGMYLECVDPINMIDNQINSIIRLGQIKAKLAHLIFVKIIRNYSNLTEQLTDESFHIYTVDSLDIFPVGWCEMNSYYDDTQKHLDNYKYPINLMNNDYLNQIEMRSDLLKFNYLSKFKDKQNWCDKIYLNLNSNYGPYFMKSKLKMLPKYFGPGPIFLVVMKLLQILISKSEKPFKTLKLLQASRRNFTNSSSEPAVPQLVKSKNMQRVRLKAKEKGKYLYRELEVCTQLNQLNEYLNDLCNKLKCCTKLLTYSDNIYSTTTAKSNDICIHFKCCLFCSINYSPSYSQQSLIEQQTKAIFSKQISTQAPAKKQSNQMKSSVIKTTQIGMMPNHSPIKTRLNVRQSLLHSLKKEQLAQQQKNESEKEAKTDDDDISDKYSRKLSLNHQRDHSNSLEPSTKKARNIKQSESFIENKCSNPTSSMTPFISQPSVSATYSNPILMNRADNKLNSLISNANMSKIINSNLNSNHLNKQDLSQHITSNPLYWTTTEVCSYLLENKFDPNLTNLIREHEIDGQSFLMLNLPTIQNYMNLKLGPAIKLAHLVERLKFNYFQQYQNSST